MPKPRGAGKSVVKSLSIDLKSAPLWTDTSLVVAFRIIEFPAEAWTLAYDFADAPIWQVWLFILMAALVAGITEEVGFRGYMQVPLEGRYGPAIGITIVSIVFVVAHLNQAWAGGGGILIMLFGISAVWGVLARVSGSLIPGIVSHTVADIANFSYWWTDVAGAFDKRPISETGIDSHFILWIAVFVASLALFALAAAGPQLHARKREPASCTPGNVNRPVDRTGMVLPQNNGRLS